MHQSGPRRVRAAEERPAPPASAARAKVAEEGRHRLHGFEVLQESRDEEMSEASVTSNAENVEPRFEVTREDSTEVSSRMEDVLPSRKRGSE